MPGPIAELQTIQHRVAEIELLLLQARARSSIGTAESMGQPARAAATTIAWQLAAAKYIDDEQRDPRHRSGAARRRVGRPDRARPLERYFRDVRAGLGHPPMDDVALTLIGKAALGL